MRLRNLRISESDVENRNMVIDGIKEVERVIEDNYTYGSAAHITPCDSTGASVAARLITLSSNNSLGPDHATDTTIDVSAYDYVRILGDSRTYGTNDNRASGINGLVVY